MKNTIKTCAAILMIIGLWSCENEENFQILEPQQAAFAIITPDSGVSTFLNQQTPNNTALTLTWEKVDYGTPTEVTYTVQFSANGTDFATPVDVSSSSGTKLTMTVAELNTRALQLGLTPQSEGAIDVRIKSSVGTTTSQEKFSEKISVLVTPYSTELPKIYMIGSFLQPAGYGNNWTTGNNLPALAASAFGKTDYEGYIYFANADAQYKFIPQNTSFDGDYGDSGSSDGSYNQTLKKDGEVNAGLPSTGVGYYRVTADTGLLTYSLNKQTWRIIGAATGSWDNDTNMTFDPVTKKWSVVLNLSPGEFKFRANGDWSNSTNNFGKGENDKLGYNGGNLVFAGAAGSYKVTLDLTNPRSYTYTITAN